MCKELLLVTLLSALSLLSTVIADSHSHSHGTIPEELAQAGASVLVDLVNLADLADILSKGGPFTVFAPDNAAFSRVPADVRARLTSDVKLLKKVLLYHVVNASIHSSDARNDVTVPSMEGANLRVNLYLKSKFYPGFITINGKRVTKADIPAKNGVIHLVSDVLYPIPKTSIAGVVSSDTRFSTLLAAVKAAGLVDTLAGKGPFTLFAPTNEAFYKINPLALKALLKDKAALTKVLLRHVVPGTIYSRGICWKILKTAGGKPEDEIETQVFRGGVVHVVSTSGGATVIEADIGATNGVIHAIDHVI